LSDSVIAATVVWNFGDYKPRASNITLCFGFLPFGAIMMQKNGEYKMLRGD